VYRAIKNNHLNIFGLNLSC